MCVGADYLPKRGETGILQCFACELLLMPLVCVEKGLKSDQGRKGVQVSGRLPRSGGRGIGQGQACTSLGRETGNYGKVCVGRGWVRVLHVCVL